MSKNPHEVRVDVSNIRKGESYFKMVQGGFIKRIASESGVVVTIDEVSTFISWKTLNALKKKQS